MTEEEGGSPLKFAGTGAVGYKGGSIVVTVPKDARVFLGIEKGGEAAFWIDYAKKCVRMEDAKNVRLTLQTGEEAVFLRSPKKVSKGKPKRRKA